MLSHVGFSKGNRGAVILMMALAMVAFGRLPLEAQNTTLTGVIKNAAGEPVAGALVKVRGADSNLTFLVVSQAQGRYNTPNLLPGQYTVQGIGGGYQSDPAGPVEVTRGQPGKLDLVLSAPQKMTPPEKKMTNADYAKLMPEGDAKRLIITRCVVCHGLERPVPRRAKREEWENTIDRMSFYLGERKELGGALPDQQKDAILEYLVKNFGPDIPRLPAGPSDPNRHLPRTLLQGPEAKYVAVELDLRSVAGVFDVAVDSQGIAWVSEEKHGTGMLGRFDPKSLTYTRIALPPAKSPPVLGSLAVDPQDRVWITDDGPNARVLQYNPTSKQFNSYDIPTPPRFHSSLNTIRFHPDGSVWGAAISSSRILKLDPLSRKITEYPVPMGSHPYCMVIAGENTIWYSGQYDNTVVKVDPNTGKLTPYKVPTPKSDLRRMGVDADGNPWVAELEGGKLVKVDFRTGNLTEIAPPTKDSGPQDINVDRKRNLIWFNERNADKIARFDPRTNTFVEFPLPNADNDGRRVLVDPSNPNRVWWDARIGRIGYIEVIE